MKRTQLCQILVWGILKLKLGSLVWKWFGPVYNYCGIWFNFIVLKPIKCENIMYLHKQWQKFFICLSGWPERLRRKSVKIAAIWRNSRIWSKSSSPWPHSWIVTFDQTLNKTTSKILSLLSIPVSSFIFLQDICIWKAATQVTEFWVWFEFVFIQMPWLLLWSHLHGRQIALWAAANSERNTTATSVLTLLSWNQEDG